MSLDERTLTRPGLVAGACLATGAWVGLSPVSAAVSFEGALLAAGLACVLTLLVASRGARVKRAALGLLFLDVGLAAGRAQPPARQVDSIESAIERDEVVHFTGTLSEPVSRRLAKPRWNSDRLQPRLTLVVDVDGLQGPMGWVPARTKLVLGAEDVPLESHVGDRVEGRARLLRVREPANPGEPDDRPRLERAGVGYVGGLERGSLATLTIADSFARRAEVFRGEFTRFVESRVADQDRAALVAALAVGERGGVSSTLSEDFNASGLAHVLSISGLHLAVVVLLLYQLLRRAFGLSAWISSRVAPRRLAALVALPITAVYVVVIGAPPPALRAGLGSALFLGAIIAGRGTDGLNTLGWCLAAVAVGDPRALSEPSTQLSFAGVLGLVVLAPRLRELLPIAPPQPAESTWVSRLGEGALQLVVSTVAATLATAPLTAIYFERASLVAAAANVAAWPAATLIVPAGAAGAVAYTIHPALAGPLVDLASGCAWVLVWAARFFASWPAAAIHVAPPGILASVAYLLGIWSIANVKRWRKAFVGAGLGAAAALGLVASVGAERFDGRLEVTFLSVGQGDSTFVRFPGGASMLVDAGGEASQRFDPGERIVTPFLRSRGVSRLDVVVASHPHPDHIGGLPAVLARFPTQELWHDGVGAEDGPLADLLEKAGDLGVRPVEFRQGLPAACPALPPLDEALSALAVGDPRCAPPVPERVIDGVRVEVLHPLAGPDRPYFPELGENDDSLVLRLTYGEVRVLLPGDVEREGESVLLARPVDVTADIAKAPHHGSRTSSTEAFVRRVSPKHVVFCVGIRNQWGFPAPEVVRRYEGAGCRSWRTDENGAVTFRTDGRSIEASAFRAR